MIFERNVYDNRTRETSRKPAGTRPRELRGGVNNNKRDGTLQQYGNFRRVYVPMSSWAKYYLESPHCRFSSYM